MTVISPGGSDDGNCSHGRLNPDFSLRHEERESSGGPPSLYVPRQYNSAMPRTVTESYPAFTNSAALYDDIYLARGKDYRTETAYLCRLIKARKPSLGGSLLDVGCGTGEHLRHFLAQADLAASGIDQCAEMLAIAQRKLEGEFGGGRGVILQQADMTKFDLAQSFDVITCLFASIAYLADDQALRRAIRNMARHLAPGGLLLLEPGLMPHQLKAPKQDQMTCTIGDAQVHRTTTAQLRDNTLIIRFDFEIRSPQGNSGFSEEHVIQLFTRENYEQSFIEANLKVEYDPQGPGGRGLFIGSTE